MVTYHQDYKVTVGTAFSALGKVYTSTKDFWCGDSSKNEIIQQLGRSFKYETTYRDKELSKWVKFLEGFGLFVQTDEYRGEGEVYRHESEEHGIIEVWYETEFEDDFSPTKIN
jgi:hypothetical protein